MNLDPSAEVTAMATADRKKWLTVAEAQRVRKAWESQREAMDKVAEKFDEDSENESEALVFIVLSALTTAGFMQAANDAATKLKELLGDA